ncbi:ATP-grasp domain-containing protein [Allocoprobacillus halotolerans]|uniref:ATP-grasp domain-containing protein n=1 Tax=Allocoprobacillus halotolerans TaxID=2944914 RepID=A0ABY5HYC9_9FIRM|nr:ATP-grasp domain-containing protein [Allocoprobacillus halotolerans]UTY38078.1 ATP-grasp domain-containing protein [Allocoprobacillus halotolerans]
MMDFNVIIKLYHLIKKQSKLNKEYGMIFVYNSDKTVRDKEHLSECVLPAEKNMIESSFRKVFEYVYTIDGEESFINKIESIRKKHKYVLVYSMAQNIDGIGRRCLIPLLCDYYNLINISADFMASTFSDNKLLMFNILSQNLAKYFPITKYHVEKNDFEEICKMLSNGKWVIKPNDESASIGVHVIDFSAKSKQEIEDYIHRYQNKYPIFSIQKFIDGQEVAVPLLKFNEEYYCPGISEVIFHNQQNYLDYDTVMLEGYSFKEYEGELKEQLIDVSIEVAKSLNFEGISRIDFRISNNQIYIEDIGANPTISETNGVNMIFCDKLSAESSCVYELLIYVKLIGLGLFIPSFNQSK